MTSPQRCTRFDCTTGQGVPRFAVYSVSWPGEPWLNDAYLCEEHAHSLEALQTTAVLHPLTLAPPLYGPPARKAGKAPGEYLVECIAIGDLVKPYRALFASRVERITDHGGSIVLHLENGAQLEQVWGHVVEVVAPTLVEVEEALQTCTNVHCVPTQIATHSVGWPTSGPIPGAYVCDEHAAALRLTGSPAVLTPLAPAAKGWTPPIWDCRTPSGHHFTMSFSSIEQRDAVESHWLDRHDYCRICGDCDGCRHPDCDTCHCD